jgi:predicted nucleotidyltransferase
MNLFARLDEATRTQGLSFLIIGGHAVNAHGFARFTRDLDLLICRTDVEKWLAALKTDGYTVKHDGGNFLQLSATAKDAAPVDFMLVNEPTFLQMKAAATEVQIQDLSFLVPCLDHLLALKVHALKHGPSRRGYKDLVDVLSLVDANRINVRSDKFRALCDKYGDAKIYEQILDFGQDQGSGGATR